MSIERGGYIQDGVSLMGRFSNLACSNRPYFSVRFKVLGHLGLKIPAEYFGGSMTWDELGSAGVPWGTSETIIYDTLEEGWTYVFNPGRKTFTVTDNLGNITVHSNVKTISELGIVWDILESPQFKLVFDASFENNAFLPAWKYITQHIPPGEEDPLVPEKRAMIMEYCWSVVDSYLNTGEAYYETGRFILPKEKEQITDSINATIDGFALTRTILLASETTELSAYGSYPSNFYKGKESLVSLPDTTTKSAHFVDAGSFLMIASFATIMNATRPVLEPWMLWKMWQWVGASSVVVTRERVFDLSPWWG